MEPLTEDQIQELVEQHRKKYNLKKKAFNTKADREYLRNYVIEEYEYEQRQLERDAMDAVLNDEYETESSNDHTLPEEVERALEKYNSAIHLNCGDYDPGERDLSHHDRDVYNAKKYHTVRMAEFKLRNVLKKYM